MRVFTAAERRNRLARRCFLAADAGESVVAISTALVGLHATDPATPYLSLWARPPDFATADLDHQLYRTRAVVKHLAMRRMLWLVGADALMTVQSGASDRVADDEQRRLVADIAKSGIAKGGDRWLRRAGAAVLQDLTAHGPASSTELRAALPELAGSYDPAQ